MLDTSLDGVRSPRLVKRGGRLRLEAKVGGDDVSRVRRYERIPAVNRARKKIDPELMPLLVAGEKADDR